MMLPHERCILVPYDPAEAITPKEAAYLASVSQDTVINWCALHGVGRKVGGRWRVSHPALLMLLDSDHAALAAYHAGDRSSGRVLPYFKRAGITLKAA